MNDRTKKLLVKAIDVSGLSSILRPVFAGRGVIFMLHRVVREDQLALMRGNVITDVFLDDVLQYVRRLGWDIVGLGEVLNRLRSGSKDRFACFTFDDGYADNLDPGLAVFRRHAAPMVVFLCTGFVDRSWDRSNIGIFLLESYILHEDHIELEVAGQTARHATRTADEKQAAYASVRRLGWRDPAGFDAGLKALWTDSGRAPADVFADYFLDWESARELARDPLVEIGAHAVTHRRLSALSDEDARLEIAGSGERILAMTGVRPASFAYPYGGPGDCGAREYDMAAEAGYAAAVTGRMGNVHTEHAQHVHALPRVALSMAPHAATREFIKAALFGSRNAIMNRFRRVVVT